jgi:uncharacterized membrane protein YvbJ
LISPGVYGKFSENEKQVKLRMYDPEIDGESAIKRGKIDRKKAPDSSDASRKAGIPKGTIIMLALFAIILVLFIVLILISW